MAQLIDGKQVASYFFEQSRQKVAQFQDQLGLAVVQSDMDPDTLAYFRQIERACSQLNIRIFHHVIDQGSRKRKFDQISALIPQLNAQSEIHGMILLGGYPQHIKDLMSPTKDIEGLCSSNVAALAIHGSKPKFIPCTALAVVQMLQYYSIDCTDKHVVIFSRSNVIGRPLFNQLIYNNCAVTVIHARTPQKEVYIRMADVFIIGIGLPLYVKGSMLKPGAVVVDIGINEHNGQIVGDCDFEDCKTVAGWITPVPGGVGPVTVQMLIKNLIQAYEEGARSK